MSLDIKLPYFDTSKLLSYLKSTLLNFKEKKNKSTTKVAWFGCFLTKLWKKLLSYLKSVSSNLSKCKVSCKTIFLTLGVYRPELKNTMVILEISTIESVKIQSFTLKLKKKFGTKIGYFWPGIWKKLLSYLKSAPSNLSIFKVSC